MENNGDVMKYKQYISVKDMVLTALFAARLCVVAPFSSFIGPIPLSLATLVIYIAAASLGFRRGALAVVIYVLLGAAGVPVFSGFEGGLQKIVGPTGGFIVGYIPLAVFTGLIVIAFKRNIIGCIVGMVVGTVLLYVCGAAWFMLATGSSLSSALALCVVPFLFGDTLKIVAACAISPALHKILDRQQAGGQQQAGDR
jgi:biotin transport system substrate-specific component